MSEQQSDTVPAQQRNCDVGHGKPKKDASMPVKWHEVIDYMVIGGMAFQDAMRSTRYSYRNDFLV
ncbi:MAG: hypothetical protein GY809_00525 [Planctomycetes bacterium]|nr:hypothetical protein [Planctomycetota bacterium]